MAAFSRNQRSRLHPLTIDPLVAAQGQDFDAGFRHRDRMFELGGKLAVARHDRPSVLLCRDLAAALVEHRLDGEDHALAQFHPRTRPAEMEDIRFLVHLAPDAMAAIVAHDRIAVPFSTEEHTSELQSLMRNTYAVFCFQTKNIKSYIP